MSEEKDEVADLLNGQVRELVKLVSETDIAELRIERGDLKLYITKRAGNELPLVQVDGADESLAPVETVEASFVTAPMVGRFYRSGPSKPPLIICGDLITKGQKVCVVESMKILNDIVSEYDGQVEEILCEDGQAVEYGQPLFRLRPAQSPD